MEINNNSVLEFILRVILGLLFFFQGYDKVVRVGVNSVIKTFRFELGPIKVPGPVLNLATYFTSYAEFIGGVFLIIGLFTKVTLYIIGIDLILVVGAFSMIKPMWDMQFVFPRLIMFTILLYLPKEYHVISADRIIQMLSTKLM